MNILIVDDEKLARDRLRALLEELPECTVCGEAAHGADALLQCDELKPDTVLMDIRMPGMDGVEAARHLAALEEPPAVIFTTAYNEYAIDAFDAQAVGYLMKPVRVGKLEKALAQARRLTRPQIAALDRAAGGDNGEVARARTHISARVGDRLRVIAVSDILYFQADQKYVGVGVADGEVLIDDSLVALEEEFGSKLFLRVHRNALVAVAHLHAIEKDGEGGHVVRVRGSEKRLAVSRRHTASLRKLVKRRAS